MRGTDLARERQRLFEDRDTTALVNILGSGKRSLDPNWANAPEAATRLIQSGQPVPIPQGTLSMYDEFANKTNPIPFLGLGVADNARKKAAKQMLELMKKYPKSFQEIIPTE